MHSITVFVSPAVRPLLLKQLRNHSSFRKLSSAGSIEACCPGVTEARADAIIIELPNTTATQIQEFVVQLELADYHPAMLLFSIQSDGSINYTISDADALPLSSVLEEVLLAAMEPQYRCSRRFFRTAPWHGENTSYFFSDRSRALSEMMCGVTEQEARYYIRRYDLDLREGGYYAFFWELNYTLFSDHYRYKDIYNTIGSALQESCRRIIEKYNGGEVFFVAITQLCIIINDFHLSSETEQRRRLRSLLAELSAVMQSGRALQYISKPFRSICQFRSICDAYEAERTLSFFDRQGSIFDSSDTRHISAQANSDEINAILEQITRYLKYDLNNPELDRHLHSLFFDILKPSCDIPMYYYTAAVLSSKLMNIDAEFDKDSISQRLDSKLLRHSSIEDEYMVFCRAIENARRRSGGKSQSQSSLMLKALDFIHKNYRDNILVSDIANSLYISETYLSRISRAMTGKSMVQHLIEYRIEQAKNALDEEDIPIYMIAEQCGFRDVRHFSKTFKKHCGMSPSEYRRSHL